MRERNPTLASGQPQPTKTSNLLGEQKGTGYMVYNNDRPFHALQRLFKLAVHAAAAAGRTRLLHLQESKLLQRAEQARRQGAYRGFSQRPGES